MGSSSPLLPEGKYQLTSDEAIAMLDVVEGGDPEAAHSRADDVLLATVDADVREACERVVARSRWWASA